MFCVSKKNGVRRGRSSAAPASAALLLLVLFAPAHSGAQSSYLERPVPLLTGNAGYFTNVAGGQNELNVQINPVLLVPLGDRWLVESRAEFEGKFQRPPGGGSYG